MRGIVKKEKWQILYNFSFRHIGPFENLGWQLLICTYSSDISLNNILGVSLIQRTVNSLDTSYPGVHKDLLTLAKIAIFVCKVVVTYVYIKGYKSKWLSFLAYP